MRSGKVRYNPISGWLMEKLMPHSNLFGDWLFPSCSAVAFRALSCRVVSHSSEKNMEAWENGPSEKIIYGCFK